MKCATIRLLNMIIFKNINILKMTDFFKLLNLTKYFSILRNFKLMLKEKKGLSFYMYGLSKISSSDLLRNNSYSSHKEVNSSITFHLD